MAFLGTLFGGQSQFAPGQVAGAAGSQIQQGVTNGNVQNQLGATNAALGQTGALASQLSPALQQQQNTIAQQQAFANAAAAQNGLANQSSVFNQLQGVANGTGPNPAQAMLAQNTGANVANQAALMAGQRGAGTNVGLEARQAAQQGAATQQQAVGQGATMQANQSLNALGQLGGLAGQQVAQQQGAIGQLGQMTAAQQQAALQQANQAAALQQANQSQLLGAQQGQNTTLANSQASINAAQAGANTASAQGGINAGQGILQGLGTAISGGAGKAHGGLIKMADGGSIPNQVQPQIYAPSGLESDAWINKSQSSPSKPQSAAAPMPSGMSGVIPDANVSTGNSFGVGNGSDLMQSLAMAAGGQVNNPKLQQSHLSPSDHSSMLHKHIREGASQVFAAKAGGHVPGKAKIPGKKDSLKNDVVPAMLSPGEIVIPRSITQGSDAARKSAEFVARVLAKKGK